MRGGSLSSSLSGTTSISGAPTLHQVVGNNIGASGHRDQLDMQVSKGVQVFSFTFG